ncbi:hypothetical protein GYMLUDRAFT_53221 [Collybiopsis luxurians FD-317 M1]|nr:hypothetical protein GYMLUDRAFT_53221 [Collybiopsis luxurians FD-317 M1]
MHSSCRHKCKTCLTSLGLSSSLTILLFLTLLPSLGLSVEFRYIDDEKGDSVTGALPVYSPANAWTQGATCSGCGFHPDPQQAFDGTWHDTTHHTTDPVRTVQLSFNGTSVEIFCILPNPTDPTLTSTYNLTFSLDGQAVNKTFTHTSDQSNNFQFNTSVLLLSNLPQQAHMLTMLTDSTSVNSTLQFDYAIYTPLPPSSSSSSASAQLTSPSRSSAGTPSPTPKSTTLPIAVVVGATVGTLYFQSSLRFRQHKLENSRVVEPYRVVPVGHFPAQGLNTQDRPSSSVEPPSTLPSSTVSGSSNNGRSNNRRAGQTGQDHSGVTSGQNTGNQSSRAGASSGSGSASGGRDRQRNAEATSPVTAAPSSTSSSSPRREETIVELKSMVEQLKREHRELRARFMPPLYTEEVSQA